MDNICDAYKEYESSRYGCQGYCMGTRECYLCNCLGDEAKCDFYPEKRDKAKEKMTMLYKLQHMSLDEFAKFLDDNCIYDNVPWIDWMSKNYCDKCEIITEIDSYGYKTEYAPCEKGIDKCPYGMADISTLDLIKMWLEDINDD